MDLSALRGAAVDEYFRQPVVVSCCRDVLGGHSKHRGVVFWVFVFFFGGGSSPANSPPLCPQDTFDIRILMAKSVKYTVNFLEAKEGDLHRWGAASWWIFGGFWDPEALFGKGGAQPSP